MEWKLKQHILAARENWETVAMTTGIAEELVRFLERLGKESPFLEESASSAYGAASSPPIVRRGFPLPEGGWAISSFRDIGRSQTRERGNYLVHTLLVPDELMAEQGNNPVWVGVQLARNVSDPLFKRPVSDVFNLNGKGREPLEACEVDLDPTGQFRLLAFMAEEMGEAEMQRLFAQVLESSGAPMDLPMPAPNKEKIAAAARNLAGFDPEGKVPGDRLRMLRLAGALSILPVACTKRVAYAVNQEKKDTNNQYTIRVPRQPSWAKAATQEPWAWLQRCVELAAAGNYDSLIAMRDWISGLLPWGLQASRKIIDISYFIWTDFDGGGIPTLSAQSRLADLEGQKVDVTGLLVPFQPHLDSWDWQMRRNYCRQLCRIADGAGFSLSQPVLNELLTCFANSYADGSVHAFYSGLPRSAWAQLWSQSYRQRKLPAWMDAPQTNSPGEEQLKFALANFDPILVASREIAKGILENIEGRMACLGKHTDDRLAYAPFAEIKQGLRALVEVNECQPTLLRELADSYATAFVKEAQSRDWLSNRNNLDAVASELGRILQIMLPSCGRIGTRALALLLNRIRRQSYIDITVALFSLRLERRILPNLIDMLKNLDGLCFEMPEASLPRRVARVIQELSELLLDPASLESYREPALPILRAWFNENPDLAATNGFLDSFASALRTNQNYPEVVLAVGSTYLQLCPPDREEPFQTICTVVDCNGARFAKWLESGSQAVPRTRGVFLARWLHAAGRRSEAHAAICGSKIKAVLNLLPLQAQETMYYQLRNSLAGQSVLRFVLRDVGPSQSRESKPNRSRWWF